MELTKAGQMLYSEISKLISQIIDIDKKYCNSNEIVLGTYASMLSKVISGSIAEFYSKNPNVKIATITDNSKVLNFPENCDEFDIAILKKYDESQYDSKKYKFISLGFIDFVLIANNNSKLCSKKKIKLNDLKNIIIYTPRVENNSTEYISTIVNKTNQNIEIKRIDSISMAQIIQEYENCVGVANCLYLANEIEEKKVTVLNTEFKIPSTEIGIYYRKDNTKLELRNLIKIIKKNFSYNKML